MCTAFDMTLGDFFRAVCDGSKDGNLEYVAVESLNHTFEGRSGNLWINTILGASWCKRNGKNGDWGITKTPVHGIKNIKTRSGRTVMCAVID